MLLTVAALLFGMIAGVAVAQSAYAGGHCSFLCPSGGGNNGDGNGQHQTGSGPPATKSVKSCSLYATSSNFGLTCVSGTGTDHITTVGEILGHDQNPCWDVVIPPADLEDKYGVDPATADPNAPFYLHSCITGLDRSRSLWWQPTAQLNQSVIEIPATAAPCPRPYTDAMVGKCVMSLTTRQRTVVDALDSQGGKIPGIIIVPHPSTKVRTNEKVTFADSGFALAVKQGEVVKRADGRWGTKGYQAGGVQIWAERTAYKIYPRGNDDPSLPVQDCSGFANGAGACTYQYAASSATQPDEVYPFVAEADWTVYYDAGAGPVALASFQKFDEDKLPVYDVQSLVVH